MTHFGLWLVWCLAALTAAAVLTRGLIDWTLSRGILDTPNSRSMHTRVTPRGGGLAIVAVVVATSILVVAIQPRSLVTVAGVVLPALAIAAISWVDDMHGVKNRTRFAVHLAAALATTAVLGPVTQVDLGSVATLRFGPLAWPLTVIWLVGLTNAFNFMDGSDGIAGITALAVGGGIAAAAAASGLGPVAMLAAATAGAALGFLTCNWHPARIFMGDVGSAFCGFLLAALALAMPRDCLPDTLPVAVMAFWPFIFDVVSTLVRRARRGENIFDPHREHRYQRLLLAGWSHRAVASLYGGMAAFGAAVAIVPLFDPAVRGEASVFALATAVVEVALLVGLVAAAERRMPGFGGSAGPGSA